MRIFPRKDNCQTLGSKLKGRWSPVSPANLKHLSSYFSSSFKKKWTPAMNSTPQNCSRIFLSRSFPNNTSTYGSTMSRPCYSPSAKVPPTTIEISAPRKLRKTCSSMTGTSEISKSTMPLSLTHPSPWLERKATREAHHRSAATTEEWSGQLNFPCLRGNRSSPSSNLCPQVWPSLHR